MKSCFIIVLLLLPGCGAGQSRIAKPGDEASIHWKADTTAKITYHIIAVGAEAYGYDILINGKIFIHQTTVPAIPGVRHFTQREDAEKVARLVVVKIRKGLMPPAVTKAEMEALGWKAP